MKEKTKTSIKQWLIVYVIMAALAIFAIGCFTIGNSL